MMEVDNRHVLSEIKIEVTHRCTMACVHCSNSAGPSVSREMSTDMCLRILGEAAALGAKEVVFSGGEPMLWAGLLDAVAAAATKGLATAVYTSGTADNTEERLRLLRSGGLDRVALSLFGASAESHERVTRSRGSFEKTMRALRMAVKAGYDTEIHFVPLADNYRELAALAERVVGEGVRRVRVLRLVPQGRGSLLRARVPTRMQYAQLKQMILRLRDAGLDVDAGASWGPLMLEGKSCTTALTKLVILPDLRVQPCDAFKWAKAEDVVGSLMLSSLRGSSLRDCWERSPFLSLVRAQLNSAHVEPCSSCQLLDRCRSGCLAQKTLARGALTGGPDPMCLVGEGGSVP